MYELPLFPLHTVLFPGMPIHLHIFEQRYLLMMKFCIEKNQPFGVVLIRQGDEALGPLAEPYSMGCTARTIEVEPLANGRLNLTALGEERFRIIRTKHELPYLVGEVESVPFQVTQNLEVVRCARTLKHWVSSYLHLLGRANHEEDTELSKIEMPDDTMLSIYLSASLLQVPPDEKQGLLAAETVPQLMVQVKRLYKRETAVLNRLMNVTDLEARKAAWLN